jgi:hypothetical protein
VSCGKFCCCPAKYSVFAARIVTLRLFLFISEPEESDHDYQPVGGTGKLMKIKIYSFILPDYTETPLFTKPYDI